MEEFQRVFSGGSVLLDRLRQDPAVPFLNDAYSCFTLFHRRVFPATVPPWALHDRAGLGLMERCYAAARPRTFAALTIDKLLNKSSSLSPRPQNVPSALLFALRKVQLLPRTQSSFCGRLGYASVRARGG